RFRPHPQPRKTTGGRLTIVILAAGASRRLGRQKLLEEIDGRPMIRRAVDAAAPWPTVVVASASIAELLAGTDVRIVRNDEPGPAARAKIKALPDGDTQSTLRDDPSLRRRFLDVDDGHAFDDIDTEEELTARRKS